MQITDLNPEDTTAIEQAALILLDCFGHLPSGYPTLEAALEEVHNSLSPDRISRIAIDDTGTVLGWIGGMPQYNGHVWELHPLVVRADSRSSPPY